MILGGKRSSCGAHTAVPSVREYVTVLYSYVNGSLYELVPIPRTRWVITLSLKLGLMRYINQALQLAY